MLKETAAAWDEEHVKTDSHLQRDQRQFLEYFIQFKIKTIISYSLATVNMLRN